MASVIAGVPVSVLSLAGVGLAAFVALLALWRLEETAPLGVIRRRFLLGVPWGTVGVVLGLVAVYLVVQDAWGALRDPLVVPFRAWSYSYPLGMLTAAFSHADLWHITGNVLATVVYAPIVEYVWSHYPTSRGSQSFRSWRTNPFSRVGVFLGVVVAVGLLTSLFVPGPVIGFSGVVFAFAGFALVTRPLLAIVALVSVRVVRVSYIALLEPVATVAAGPEYVTPWWAGIAIQGHTFGLFVGVLLGVALLRLRAETPQVGRVWVAALLVAVSESLYAFYWYAGAETYVLFRAAGIAFVVVLATVVAAAIADPQRQLIPRVDLPVRVAATALVLVGVLAISLVALPHNVADVGPGDDLDRDLTVGGYTIGYAEDVTHGYVGSIELPVVPDPPAPNASGVIVASDARNVWEVTVSAGRLAFDGKKTISVGGLGWRERIVANRTGWNVVDGGNTYKVYLRRVGGDKRLVHLADPVSLPGTYVNRNVSIAPTTSGYDIVVKRNNSTLDRQAIPRADGVFVVGGVGFERQINDLFLVDNGTRIRVANFDLRRRSN
ncbi:rhomboid family intramembrane serine protease [Halobacteriales archaeon Cl-PHB]